MALGAAVGHFLTAKAAEGASPKTIEWYRMVLGRFGRDLGAHRDMDSLTPTELRAWLLTLRATLSPISVAGYVRGIKAFGRGTALTYDDIGRIVGERTMEVDPLPVERLRLETTYDAVGRRTAVSSFTDGTTSADDTIELSYDAHDRLTGVERGGSVLLSASTYNPDGTPATQTTPAGTSTFSYDRRDRLVGATSPLFSGSATYAWTNDDVLAGRTWPGGATAAFAYDAARRPTGMTVENGTTSVADFGRSLDRVGNVTSESQALDGVSGFAGSEEQTFTYDALRRLTASAISDGTTSDARSYTYDAGSRRTSKTENGLATTYAYDRNDQLASQTVGGGSAESFAYDEYGRMTTRASGGGTATSYAYDALDRLVGITAPGGEDETFSLDALGRKWTRSLDGVLTDTYTHLDASYSIVRINRPSLTVDAAIDALGTRIATGTSGGDFGFALPDLHGNFAAAMADDAVTISDAFRYDGYGQLLDQTTSTLPTPWRFQGKPLLSDAGDDLYDFESRAYDPGTGTFSQLDTFAGAVQHPLTLNRFLYAHANPTTLIDPDGHCPVCRPMIDGLRHQHAKAPKQSLSYAPPKASFKLPVRRPSTPPKPSAPPKKPDRVVPKRGPDQSPTEVATDLVGPFFREHDVVPINVPFSGESRPGFGTVEFDLFIQGATAPVIPNVLEFRGDGREADPYADPWESRVWVRFNFETGEGALQVNPSCQVAASGFLCRSPLPLGAQNRIDVAQNDGGLVVLYDLTDSMLPSGPSLNGTVILYPDASTGEVAVITMRDAYPAFESYQYVDGKVRQLLIESEPWQGGFGLWPDLQVTRGYYPGQ